MISEEELKSLDLFLDWAIAEDIGDGDHTSKACIPSDAIGTANLIAKEDGIIAGLFLTKYLLGKFDAEANIQLNKQDGDEIRKGEKVFTISGKVQSILTSERTILNFLQRLSGIATETSKYVKIAEKYGVRVADTRKTTPGMRLLEKAAVKAGGGSNHRMGLFDLIMIKDNHIDFAGSITKAVEGTIDYLAEQNKQLRIEVETRSISEVKEALSTGKVDIIMLDNFTPDECRKAVSIINEQCEIEASGKINLDNLEAYAASGVDYISSGALTHSVKSLDLSLRAEF